MQPRVLRFVLAAGLPPLALAVAGLAHPMRLTDATAGRWHVLHVVLLPLFPLLALGPWLLARRVHPWLGWVVGLLGYAYAVCYTGLDVLAGIGAGSLQQHGDPSHKQVLYDQGNALAGYGVSAYLVATVLVAAALLYVSRDTPSMIGAVLVVAGAVSFLSSHVYWPRGVLTMLALAIGWALLAGHALASDELLTGRANK